MNAITRLVNDAIHTLCGQLEEMNLREPVMFFVAEKRLFLELTQCILGSQVKHEVSIAFSALLQRNGLLRQMMERPFQRELSKQVVASLSDQQEIEKPDGGRSFVRYRFPHRAKHLLNTARKIYGQGKSLEDLLSENRSAITMRDRLVATCAGIGPKQASLFLRKVGLGVDLAILDTHILDYMHSFWNVNVYTHSVGSLNCYMRYESTFRSIAMYFGYPINIVDMAVWATMRELKNGGQHEHCEPGIRRIGLNIGGSAHPRSTHKAVSVIH